MFAYKPAPVQISYLGYPTSIGLKAIAYRISDWQADPAGYEEFNVGELLRLPYSYYCYRPLRQAPEIAPLPVLSTGFVTFGSFNNLAKVSDQALQLWVQVVNAVPNSRLLLKAKSLADPAVQTSIRGRASAMGLEPDRLILRGWEQGLGGQLPLYSQVDIGLDTFPYNGGTTTCEALWMGVPVVSLSGATHASRMGRSLLTAAGLPELVAESTDQFVRVATRLAEDRDALQSLRHAMRQRLLSSPLFDEPKFTRDFEALLRTAWRRWCDGGG
jgi:predicted O-linked N-acetylglucosamine transferase (SPINDLY family)